MEGGCSCGRIVLADYKWLSGCQIGLDLLFGQVKAMLVIRHDLLAVYIRSQRFQTLRSTEAVISLSLFNQLLCILHIDAGGLALTLYIRAAAAVLVGTFIVDQAGFCHGAVDNVYSSFYIAFLVCIFNS